MTPPTEQFKLAKSLYEKGHYVRSQEACETLYAQQANNVNVILLWSASFYMQGEYDKSLECLKKVPVKYRKYVEILNNVAANHLKKYHYETAYDEYCRSVFKKEDYMEGWYGLIKTLIKTENYENAFDALAEILRYDTDLLTPYILCGQLLIKLNRFEEASSMFQFAMQQEPESEASWAGLGDIYALDNQFHDAIMCYQKAYIINKSSMNHLINLGFMYYALKQFDKSIEMLNFAISKMDPITNVDILNILGHAYFYNGNIFSAAQTYYLYLKYESNNPVVLHAMGLIYSEYLHNPAAPELCFKLCVALDKRNILYHACLFREYLKLEQHELAFKTAIKWAKTLMFKNDLFLMKWLFNFASILLTNDDYHNYHTNLKLGTMYHMLEFKREALLRYENAKRMKPSFPLTYSKIALYYEEENRLEDAEEFYEKAYYLSLHSLPHNQKHLDTIHNLIAIKQLRGLIDNVIGLFNHRLNQCKCDSFVIHTHLANYLYNEVGNPKEAYNNFLNALEICDTDINTYLALGKLSLELSYNNAALNYFWKALELYPNCITAHIYIGLFYTQQEQFNEAINEFEKALNLQPNYPNAYNLLIQCQRRICKFINLDGLNKFKDIIFQQLTNEEEPSISLEHSLLCDFEPEVLVQIASAFAKQYVDKPNVQQRSSGYVHDISLSNSCIRVGYIYEDSSTHPTSELVKSIRKLHDRNKFEVICYSLSPINRFRSNNLSASDCCIDISNLSSIDAAEKINADGIHILIDVGNSTKDLEYEIFVLKPAPIQVKLLGHPGTSGASFIDYLITDEKCSPPKLDCLYTEKLAYLNRTVFFGDHGLLFNDLSQRNPQNRTTNTQNSNGTMGAKSYNTMSMYSIQILPDDSIKCYTRQMYNLPEDAIVYCYFGKLYKINQTTINMWITILKSVNNSVLWLLRSIKDAENNMHEYVAMNGIDPVRVIFSNVAPKEEHLRRIQLADIFLDTPIYNGHTSCLDALWTGMPVITLSGDTFASRMTTSILSALNCIQTIAMTENDYIRIAIKLGTHTNILDQLRQQIWHSRTTSVIFDYKSYCKELENLYLHMWKKFN